MLRARLVSLGQRGDTIVEVLISIAIISLVLGGAFVATNNSLRGTRATQERSDGVKLVEGQIEQLKGLSKTDPDEIFGATTPSSFCIVGGAAIVSTSATCKLNAAGATATGSQLVYNIAITRATNTFTLTNIWLSQNGPDGQVTMRYRVYK